MNLHFMKNSSKISNPVRNRKFLNGANEVNFKSIYFKRHPWSHKGQFGYLLIVAGSERFTGSPIFNAMAALRSGVDLITVCGPKRAMDIAASFAPDIITYPLAEELVPGQVKQILNLAKNFQALVIGCGLARNKITYQAIRLLIKKNNLPMVIDAEAIRAVAEDKKVLKNKKVILTPQAEEFRILTGESVKPEVNDRRAKVKKWAAKLKAVILLKGQIDIISDGKRVVLNKTGSVYMTKGGFGDTLSGICGALLAQGVTPLLAAQAAAYINGRAGELAAEEYGAGVLASDIFNYLPEVIKKL